MGKRGPKPLLSESEILGHRIDRSVARRLRGCSELMSSHGWTMRSILERSISEFLDRLEQKAGVKIPEPGVAHKVRPPKKPKPPPPPPAHPLAPKKG